MSFKCLIMSIAGCLLHFSTFILPLFVHLCHKIYSLYPIRSLYKQYVVLNNSKSSPLLPYHSRMNMSWTSCCLCSLPRYQPGGCRNKDHERLKGTLKHHQAVDGVIQDEYVIYHDKIEPRALLDDLINTWRTISLFLWLRIQISHLVHVCPCGF
jgi:hypothetical protein